MRNLLITVASAAWLSTAALASAAITTSGFSDDFNTSQATSTNNASAGFDTGTTLMTSNGTRTIQTDIISNTAPGDARGRTAVLNGAFSFSSDDGVDGYGVLTYAFAAPISLSATPVFLFTFLGNDDTGNLLISETDSAGDVATSSYTLPNLGSGPGSVPLLFPATVAGVNSASITKLAFSFGGTPSEDLSVDSVQAVSVPEPGTLGAMIGLSLLAGAGLLARYRRA